MSTLPDSGKFSSDRTIREYYRDIWKVPPIPIDLLFQEEVSGNLAE